MEQNETVKNLITRIEDVKIEGCESANCENCHQTESCSTIYLDGKEVDPGDYYSAVKWLEDMAILKDQVIRSTV